MKQDSGRDDGMLKLLIAYDGSPGADIAIDDLQRAGLPREGVSVRVVSVADVWMPTSTDLNLMDAQERYSSSPQMEVAAAMRRRSIERATHAVHEAQLLARCARERICELFPEWKVRDYACADSPAWGIIRIADEWRPHLTVVGANTRSSLENVIFGSVAQKVVTKADSSVRIGRRRSPCKAWGAPVTLMIGLDGSLDSQAAINAVAARVWPAGSMVYLVTVLDPRMATEIAEMIPSLQRWVPDQSGAIPESEFDWIERMMKAACEQLREAGLLVTSRLVEGDARHKLLEIAREKEADCVFIGAKGLVGGSGLRHLERFMLGSTAGVVAGRASCSVEVVRSEIARIETADLAQVSEHDIVKQAVPASALTVLS